MPLSELPEFSAVVSEAQTLGKGRLGRTWQSPAGASLSLSILLKPRSEKELAWSTLIAGLSIVSVLADLKLTSGIKWPNDVLVGGKKLCGILASIHEDSLIMGIGLNLKPFDDQVPTATSLSELGLNVSLDEIAARIGAALRSQVSRFRSDPLATMAEFRANCLTLGQKVRAEFPDGNTSFGIAQDVNDLGQLVILTPEPVALSAADVWHLRN